MKLNQFLNIVRQYRTLSSKQRVSFGAQVDAAADAYKSALIIDGVDPDDAEARTADIVSREYDPVFRQYRLPR